MWARGETVAGSIRGHETRVVDECEESCLEELGNNERPFDTKEWNAREDHGTLFNGIQNDLVRREVGKEVKETRVNRRQRLLQVRNVCSKNRNIF